jgi:hypothetical protein
MFMCARSRRPVRDFVRLPLSQLSAANSRANQLRGK